MYVADGVSECSATLDDSVSEEEEGSFDELPDVTPYLQPEAEISVLNKVRLRRLTYLSCCNTQKHLQEFVLSYDATFILLYLCLISSHGIMFLSVCLRCLATVQGNRQPLQSPQV